MECVSHAHCYSAPWRTPRFRYGNAHFPQGNPRNNLIRLGRISSFAWRSRLIWEKKDSLFVKYAVEVYGGLLITHVYLHKVPDIFKILLSRCLYFELFGWHLEKNIAALLRIQTNSLQCKFAKKKKKKIVCSKNKLFVILQRSSITDKVFAIQATRILS